MNRIKVFAALLLIATSFFVTSCNNEPIDPTLLDLINNPIDQNPVDPGVFTATVDDGTNFSALQTIGVYDDSSFGPELNIIGLTANGKKISFQILNPTIGTRAANTTASSLLLFQYSYNSNDTYSSLNNSTNTSTGTITITDFNVITNKISGTFSFTGYGLTNNAVERQVTNGVFTNISFTNNVTSDPSLILVGSYLLTSQNTSVATDINIDGVSSVNQMLETSCFNNSFLVLSADNTFTTDVKYPEINFTDNTLSCMSDPIVTGTWAVSGDQLTLTYDGGTNAPVVYTISGNTLTTVITNVDIITQTADIFDYFSGNVTKIYTKQ